MTSAPPPYQPPPGPPVGGPPPMGGRPGYPPPMAGRPGYPPPPPMGAFEQPVGRVPIVAALIPVAAVLAVIGAFTPWFHSSFVLDGQPHELVRALYSWRDGKIGLVAPIGLVVASIGVLRLATGKVARFSRLGTNPVVAAARGSLIVGSIALVCCVIAWFLVPSNYYFDTRLGRLSSSKLISDAQANGHSASLDRGPQIGYYLTIAAAVIAIVAGVLMLVMRDKTAQAPATFGAPAFAAPPPPPGVQTPPVSGFAAPPTYSPAPPPISGWTPPVSTPPADSGGWSSPTSHSDDAQGTGSDSQVDLNK